MKTRFSTIDLMAALHEVREFTGLRVSNIYDFNPKGYLIRLQKPGVKATILLESGLRLHLTEQNWDKSPFPSSFSMKLRKHVKGLRFTGCRQIGVDRIVDLQFGEDERTVHVILELYDRGNILLCDHEFVILNILRPRTDKDNDVKQRVTEKYLVDLARQDDSLPSKEEISAALQNANKGDHLRRVLAPLIQFGGPLIDQILAANGFPNKAEMSINVEPNEETVTKIASALEQGWQIYQSIKNEKSKGYVTYKEDTRSDGNVIEVYQEYMPYLFAQYKNEKYKEFDSFSTAVDEFYSKLENQKHQQKALNIEKEAIRKVENVKKDQETRIQALVESEERQKLVAERIIMNEEFVERASLVIRNAIANKLTWDAIEEMRRKAAEAGDEVAKSIVKLQLDRNQFVMRLSDPYDDEEPPVDATIDLSLNAYQNSRNFFIDKKAAGEKARKTAGSAGIAIKNAQIKAKETLDKVRIKTDVAKTRKTMWFEKFLWFISSENYIVVAGRDAQQNEMLVKRYLRPGDIYVHADLRGASSVVVRNKPGGEEIPPKTLTEAAQMAVCYSNAWEAGVVASAWWVRHDQVSRTAPTGEYLASGSFMIRGKKNFMPASQLVMGFGIMFRVDEESAERHKGERKVIDSNTAAPSEIGDESAPNEEEELNLDEEDQENDGNQENEEKEEDEFPDVQVNVQTLRIARSTDEEEYSIIEIGPKNQPGNKKRSQTKAEEKALETKKYLEQKEAEERKAAASAKIAKYQKRKQQKIKKKYGDADEEETALRLQILGSRGKQDPKESEVEKKKVEEKSQNSEKPGNSEKPEQEHPERLQKKEAKKRDSDDENEKDEEEHANLEDSDAFLDQLTGKPTDEDNILYSVPMVGPYQTFSNFKYKVKLTKGTGKRGKAAKSALELFLRLKIANPREEAHIRALIGEDSVARNVPGKVRVSAPQMFSK